ncbi:hypothetical protein B4N90_12375 [Acinetobacter baumannii]|nr:hypothetical protein B4N90_12375 [Acinetobacter baumannii]
MLLQHNQLKLTQAVQLTIIEKGQNLPYAEINLREKGSTDKQVLHFKAFNGSHRSSGFKVKA